MKTNYIVDYEYFNGNEADFYIYIYDVDIFCRGISRNLQRWSIYFQFSKHYKAWFLHDK